MASKWGSEIHGYTFYDATAAGNPLARYSCVSLATAAEVTTANAAGVPGNVGEICILTPVAAGLPTRRCLGVADQSVRNGQEVAVYVAGVAYVMVNAAVVADATLFPAVASTRTSAQTPLTDLEDMLIPSDPSLAVTYNLCLADDTALPASGTLHWPLGNALQTATAQYDVIAVQLGVLYSR